MSSRWKQSSRYGRRGSGDRLLAAGIGAIVSVISIVIVVFAITYLVPTTDAFIQKVAALWWGLPVWGGLGFVVGAIAGFALGTERLTYYLGHLWGTERPARPRVTATLWGIFLLMVLGSYLALVHAI